MKAYFSILLALLILIPTVSTAESAKSPLSTTTTVTPAISQQPTENAFENNAKLQAEQRVMALPSIHAKTVDLYITRMASIPGAVDLGWQIHEVDNGYEVIREIQKGLKVFTFKWGMSDSGEITPLSKRAKDITKQPDPVPEKDAN